MVGLRLIPVVLSFLLLAAHFFRSGSTLIVVILILLLGLLAVRRPWAARVTQVLLVLGAIEWILTFFEIAAQRMSTGQPIARLAMILLPVAILTGMSALAFRSSRLRAWYRMEGQTKNDEG